MNGDGEPGPLPGQLILPGMPYPEPEPAPGRRCCRVWMTCGIRGPRRIPSWPWWPPN